AFYDVESNASSALSTTKPLAGRLYVSSNSSHLFAYDSARSIMLGGANAIVWWPGSFATIPSNNQYLTQIGSFSAASNPTPTTAFATAYNVAPALQLQMQSSGTSYQGSAALVV